ncbi:MAG: hypothetical protein WBD07_08890 [Vicinamibacterales bacterium]
MKAVTVELALVLACALISPGAAFAQVLIPPPMPSTGGPPDLFLAGPGTYAPRFTEPARPRLVSPWRPVIVPPIAHSVDARPTRPAPLSPAPRFYVIGPSVTVGTSVLRTVGPQICVSTRLSDCLSRAPRY